MDQRPLSYVFSFNIVSVIRTKADFRGFVQFALSMHYYVSKFSERTGFELIQRVTRHVSTKPPTSKKSQKSADYRPKNHKTRKLIHPIE